MVEQNTVSKGTPPFCFSKQCRPGHVPGDTTYGCGHKPLRARLLPSQKKSIPKQMERKTILFQGAGACGVRPFCRAMRKSGTLYFAYYSLVLPIVPWRGVCYHEII